MASLASQRDPSTSSTQSDAAAGAATRASNAFVSGGEAETSSSADIFSLRPGPELCKAFTAELDKIKHGRWNATRYIGGRPGKTAVIKATDSRLGQVALKLVASKDAATKRRFNREVAFMQRISHPNVVTCKAGPFASEDGTLMFCVLEWISGGSLSQLREEKAAKRLSEKLVIQMVLDVLSGLQAVHHKGVVHCDLKCDNIMYTSDGGFKIVDFGIAFMDKYAQSDVSQSMVTKTGVHTAPTGTLHYMSPEQFEQKSISFASDIWAVGVIMHRNLCGSFPFGANDTTLFPIAFSVLRDPLVPLQNISDGLWRIVSKALKKDKAERYGSPESMLAELIPLKESVPLPPGCKWHFFICKNEGPGAQAAMVIYHELRAQGYKVWISNDVEGPNADRMREGVQQSAVFLVYLTKGIFSRPWCRDVEMLKALRCKKPFVVLACKKGEFRFDVGLKDEELQKAPEGFRPFGEQILNQVECVDWSLNRIDRPASSDHLREEDGGRDEIAKELYDGPGYEWVASESDETASPQNGEQASDRFEGNMQGGESKVVQVQRKKVMPGALHFACRQGHLDAVKTLLSMDGIGVNQATEYGVTPLYIACQNGHLDVVNALLSSDGIDINQADKFGTTPLCTACWNGHLDVVNALLSMAGININQGNESGATPLFIACRNGHLDVLNALLSRDGIDINRADKNGATPLYVACQNGHLDVVSAMLSRDGVDINQANNDGVTPLYVACDQGHLDVVNVLLSKEGVDLNQARKQDGSTPLCIACYQGFVNIANALIRKDGIDINLAEKQYGATPLYIACLKGHSEIIKMLEEAGAK